MSDFADKVKLARKAQEQAKKLEKDPFAGMNLPESSYIARLQQFSVELSKKAQEPQVRIDWLVTEGEQEGNVQRTWSGLLNEYSAARVRRFVAMHGNEVGEMIDWDETDKEKEFRFDSNFVEAVKEIEDAAKLYRIEVKHSEGDNRTFVNVEILQILDDEETSAEPTRHPVKKEGDKPDIRKAAILFCIRYGIDVDKNADLSTVVEELKTNVFWPEGTTKVQLKKAGYEKCKPEDSEIGAEEVALLDTIGADEAIICR